MGESFGGGARTLGSVRNGEGGGRRGWTADFEVAGHGEAALDWATCDPEELNWKWVGTFERYKKELRS